MSRPEEHRQDLNSDLHSAALNRVKWAFFTMGDGTRTTWSRLVLAQRIERAAGATREDAGADVAYTTAARAMYTTTGAGARRIPLEMVLRST